MQLNGKEGLKSLNHYLWDLEFTAHEDNIYIDDHIAHIAVVYMETKLCPTVELLCMMSLTYWRLHFSNVALILQMLDH